MEEPCRKASEVNSLSELGLSESAEKLVQGMDPEELILSVREDKIYGYSFGNEYLDKAGAQYLADEIEAVLNGKGFIRGDLKESLSPESHFVKRYVIALDLMEGQGYKCLPFCKSNEAYETYTFTDRRLDRILAVLEKELTKKQFRAVKSDIFSPTPRKGGMVREAKKSLVENRDEICVELFKIFA